jgi:acyl carrier protein|tara:strand:+ start:941 stop:1186 length:246 start_codon:yes stop_codon:yes gene_type:complete
MSEVKTTIIQMLSEKFDLPADRINLTDHFIDDLHGDSLDTVEMGIEVETKFDILIPDDKLEKMATVGDLVAFVEKETKNVN